MSAPSVEQAVLEMRGVAERMRAEAAVMRAETRQQAQRYIALGLFIAAYMSWAFVRTAHFVDADQLAVITGDLLSGSAQSLVEDAITESSLSPAEAIRYAETQVEKEVTESAKGLNRVLESDLPSAVAAYYVASDRSLLDSIAKLPNASRLVTTAGMNPDKAAAALLAAQAKPGEKSAVPPALVFVRDRVQRLASRQPLSIAEQAQRRILQAAFTQAGEGAKP